MDLRVLRYFLAIASEENITRASEVLHVTQPALSRQIKNLEEELGKKLFVRGKRKVTLTSEGQLLKTRAEEIIELVTKTETELMTPEEIIGGDIYIGCGESIAIQTIMKTASAFQTTYPQVCFQLFSSTAIDICERLDKGLLDFGILHGDISLKKYSTLSLPMRDVWGVLMRKDDPLAAKASISPADLRNAPLIVSRRSVNRGELERWLGCTLTELHIRATYDLVFNAVFMAVERMGYMICLDRLISEADHAELCFRPLIPKLEASLSVIWKKYQTFSPASERFLQQLTSALEQK